MTKKWILKAFFVLSFLFPHASHAIQYSYAGLVFRCEVTATREAIGETRTTLGSTFSSHYGIQLFSSSEHTRRMTSFKKGTESEVLAFLNTGGIPNKLATENRTVDQNQTTLDGTLEIPRTSLVFPVHFGPSEQGDDLTASLRHQVTFQELQELLTALGDSKVPDFQKNPPIVTRMSRQLKGDNPMLVSIEMSSGRWDTGSKWKSFLEWQYSANNLRPGFWQGDMYKNPYMWGVQVHYPSDKFNGLSYHLDLWCNSVRH
jgi:hypothetical protein